MGIGIKEKLTRSERYSSILIILGILNISYILFGFSLGWGFYFGLKIIALYGVLLLAHGVLTKYNCSYRTSYISKTINLGILAAVLLIIVMEAAIGYGAIFNNLENVDYVYILGAGIVEDRPSLELKSRLDKTIEYVNCNKGVKKIILCGGKGANERYTEAYVMEKYLLSRGIDQNMLIKEEKSTTTYENIKFAANITANIDEKPNKKIALVSNYFHVFRAKLIAGRMGLKVTGLTAATPLYIIPNHHMREYFAIIKCLFLG